MSHPFEAFDAPADPFATYDAAYVLGALSPADRAAFEQHLRHCDACSAAVRELAGMPGLLAQVDVVHQLPPEAPPPELLPSLLAKVRRQRRRRLVATVAGGVAAVAAGVAVLLAVVLPDGAGSRGEAMTALGRYPVQADVALTEAAWGTKVDMSCSYRGAEGGDYVLVAVQDDGRERRLASWYAVPQDTAELSIGTPLRRGDIDFLEIRLPGGPALLRLPVSP